MKADSVSYDFLDVPFVSPEDEALSGQQWQALDDLGILLEHSVVARPTIYRVVNNKNMVQSVNWVLAEVHRTRQISRRVREMVVDFQSLLAYIAQEGAVKYRQCQELQIVMDDTYHYLMKCERDDVPMTPERLRLRQEFGRGKQGYYATEDELRQFTIRGNIVHAFYDRLRDAIRGNYDPLNLEDITGSSHQITDKFWPLDGKF